MSISKVPLKKVHDTTKPPVDKQNTATRPKENKPACSGQGKCFIFTLSGGCGGHAPPKKT